MSITDRVVELHRAGYTIREIAGALQMRQQHVYNVLGTQKLRDNPTKPTPTDTIYGYCPRCNCPIRSEDL